MPTKTTRTAEQKTAVAFPIVGIGASAGGLESLESFFHALGPKPGAAFIVIQHLSPDFKSYMPELLGKQTSMKVCTAEHLQQLAADTVYLLPPKKNLVLQANRLQLSNIQRHLRPNKPIDLFFSSLAAAGQENIMAVVFSGTGSDGALGIREVFNAGGLTFVESAGSAAFDGMPNAALASHACTFTGTPKEIAQRIFSLSDKPPVASPDYASVTAGSTVEAINYIFELIAERYQVDFSEYKISTIQRRIDKRRIERELPDIAAYAERLQEDATELQALYYELLIGVTTFFRDPEAFALLRKQIAKKIASKLPGESFRVWVPGCATGEEAYSIAILVSEESEKANKSIDCKIFATDIDDQVLSIAAQGIFSADKTQYLPSEILDKYFQVGEDSLVVSKGIRGNIVFAKQNILADAPFTKLDLISCRNLLIYLDAKAKQRVLSLFYFSLRPKGLLFLGPSESLGLHKTGYRVIDSRWKLFLKTDQAPEYMAAKFSPSVSSFAKVVHGNVTTKAANVLLNSEVENAHIALAELYLPPGLLIDEDLTFHHVYGELPDLVKLKAGKFSQNLRDLCPDAFCSAVSASVVEAKAKGQVVAYTNFVVEEGDGVKQFDFKVLPLKRRKSQRGSPYFLLAIEGFTEKALPHPAIIRDASELQQFALLEQELAAAKQALQTNTEELANANEELQSTNEELMAANEELQSTNEELQSVNEELYSVNAEHQQKIVELTQLSADEENLLQSTNIGTVFLDRAHSVRKYTPAAAKLFNLLPQDIGRPFGHISHHFKGVDFNGPLNEVNEFAKTRELEACDGRNTYLIRFNAYINERRQLDGKVLTCFDITAQKHAQTAYEAFSHSSFGNMVVSPTGKVLSVNKRLLGIMGFSEQELLGHMLQQPELQDSFANFSALLASGSDTILRNHEVMVSNKQGKQVWLEVNVTPFTLATAEPAVLIAVSDISEHRAAQASAKAALAEQTKVSQVLQSIIDNNPMGIHQWALNEKEQLIFQHGNAAANKMLGFDHDTIIGKTIEEAFPGLEGSELVEQCIAVAKAGGEFSRESHTYQDDKIASTFYSTYFQGAPGTMISIFQDLAVFENLGVSPDSGAGTTRQKP